MKRIRNYIGNEPFMLTYGDGVSNINLEELLKYHQKHGRIGTMSSYLPEGRFGVVEIGEDNRVLNFHEKPQGDGGWINIGFFVFQPEIFDYLTGGDDMVFEREPLECLARNSQLITYKHHGFWKCMDTIKDKMKLEALWEKGAPWKIWE